jgi:hypothetical protein
MTVGSGGVEYENKVLREIKKQIKGTKGLYIKEGASTAAFSAHEPDLVLMTKSKPINIEIKQDSKAQMGGTSYNYDMKTKNFTLAGKPIDDSLDKEFKQILAGKTKDLNSLLNYVKKNDHPELAKNVKGLTLSASKGMWETLTREGYLVPLNAKIQTPINFLYEHYHKKNCYYIQIGGSGLYYLKKNPLKLPVPQLDMDFNIEIRLGRGGARRSSSLKLDVASGNLRVQGRLGGKLKPSPYSLDKPGDFTKLFGHLYE